MTSELQEQILDELADRIQSRVDFDVLAIVMVESGWTLVEVSYQSLEHRREIEHWVVMNCEKNYKNYSSEWLFESIQDASFFALKWK